MKYKSDSAPLEAPKEPDGAVVYELYKLVASESDASEMAKKLRAGGYGWGHAKQELFVALDAQLAPLRERYHELRADEAHSTACWPKAPTRRARSRARRCNACAARSASRSRRSPLLHAERAGVRGHRRVVRGEQA